MNYVLILNLLSIGIIGGIIISYVYFKLFFKNNTTSKEVTQNDFQMNDDIDKLTSLYNRVKFLKDLDKAKGILLIDIDDFSIINDVYTKDIGDEILKKFAYHLKYLKSLQEYEVYRLGGDEFAILSSKETDLKSISDDIIKMVEKFYLLKDNIPIQITLTIGISYEKPLLETADIALKYGKREKENIVIFSHNLGEKEDYSYFIEVVTRIKQAIQYDNVVPFFQCIKDKDGKTVQYEALMRLKEGEKYITPAVFLKIAKQTKLYNELTKKMIIKTFDYMKKRDIPFSINLSYDDMRSLSIKEVLFEKIEEIPKKSNIIIELLETEAIKKFDKIKDFIDILKNKGVKIAIDDFGSGYSNFIYLEKLNPDIIKIDGEIVSNVLLSSNAEFLVKTVVDFCHKNNIISVAEYVSHIEIFKELEKLGVDEYQGFYFCKPQKDIK
jgi:diguanylate cyclase (GGDEF)-like protein